MALYFSLGARWGTKDCQPFGGRGQGCLVGRRIDRPGADRKGQRGRTVKLIDSTTSDAPVWHPYPVARLSRISTSRLNACSWTISVSGILPDPGSVASSISLLRNGATRLKQTTRRFRLISISTGCLMRLPDPICATAPVTRLAPWAAEPGRQRYQIPNGQLATTQCGSYSFGIPYQPPRSLKTRLDISCSWAGAGPVIEPKLIECVRRPGRRAKPRNADRETAARPAYRFRAELALFHQGVLDDDRGCLLVDLWPARARQENSSSTTGRHVLPLSRRHAE
jgi:hypothetical protein